MRMAVAKVSVKYFFIIVDGVDSFDVLALKKRRVTVQSAKSTVPPFLSLPWQVKRMKNCISSDVVIRSFDVFDFFEGFS